ncbi:MAG TPA: hypothetical protein VET27_25930 [Mycobacterium sp.]|nr:hypothetical protein [Mycobacterium sp.]
MPLSIETDPMSDPRPVLADTDAAGLGTRALERNARRFLGL